CAAQRVLEEWLDQRAVAEIRPADVEFLVLPERACWKPAARRQPGFARARLRPAERLNMGRLHRLRHVLRGEGEPMTLPDFDNGARECRKRLRPAQLLVQRDVLQHERTKAGELHARGMIRLDTRVHDAINLAQAASLFRSISHEDECLANCRAGKVRSGIEHTYRLSIKQVSPALRPKNCLSAIHPHARFPLPLRSARYMV